MKLKDIIKRESCLASLAAAGGVAGALGFKVGETINAFREAWELHSTQRNALLAELGRPRDDGNVALVFLKDLEDPASLVDNRAEFARRYDELLETEVELTLPAPLSRAEVEKVVFKEGGGGTMADLLYYKLVV